MLDPTITAAREIIEESIEGMRGAIAGLPANALNWRPAGEGTNPIAVLAVPRKRPIKRLPTMMVPSAARK